MTPRESTPDSIDPLGSALDEVETTWEALAREDPLWAILVEPGKERGGWDPSEFFERGRAEIAQALSRARGLSLPVSADGRALDFGCGAGRLTQGLAAHFAHVDGVDVSPTMIELARKYNRFPDTCRYHVNPASDLRLFESNQFEFIYSNCVLQHMAPSLALSYIREFVRVLKPAKTLVFQVPDLLGGPKFTALSAASHAASRLDLRRRAGRLIGHRDERSPLAEMKMFTISQPIVEGALDRAGADVVHVDFLSRAERTFHGPLWERLAQRWNVGFVSKTYYATKRA